MRRILQTTLLLCLIAAFPAQAQTPETSTTTTELLQAALLNNPQIRAARDSVSAAEGNALQQSLRPNPNAFMEAENFAGERDLNGFDGAEFTLGIEQTIETAGKRKHRGAVARHELSMAEQQAVEQILAILAEVEFAAMDYAIAQERLVLAGKRLTLADETHEAVKKRVDAAAASDIEHAKIDIEQKTAQVQQQQAARSLSAATLRLTTLIGTEALPVIPENLLHRPLPERPERSALLLALENAPQTKGLELNRQRAGAAVDLARAQSAPDVTLGLGVRHFNDRDDEALMATFSMPLPVFNRNQGGIAQARAERNRAEAELEAGKVGLQEAALNAWEQFGTAREEARIYEAEIVPGARRAYRQVADGYAAGRYALLELLDTQRTLYQVQDAQLQSLISLYEAKAQIDILMNTHEALVITFLNSNTGETQ